MVTLSDSGLNESAFVHFLESLLRLLLRYMDVAGMENAHSHKSCIVLLANLYGVHDRVELSSNISK
jgi:hypothetical protein